MQVQPCLHSASSPQLLQHMQKMRSTAQKLKPTLELAKFFSELYCQEKPCWKSAHGLSGNTCLNESRLGVQRLNMLVAGVDVICCFILGFIDISVASMKPSS